MKDRLREALRWLQSAREELEYARHAASGGYHPPACFHAQQAAEMAVKAVHYNSGARAVIGHNVRSLIQALEPRSEQLSAQLDGARELDLLYLPTRYPNGLDQGTPAEAFSSAQSTRAIGFAELIVEAASQSIEG